MRFLLTLLPLVCWSSTILADGLIHLRVYDAETGKDLPARVQMLDGEDPYDPATNFVGGDNFYKGQRSWPPGMYHYGMFVGGENFSTYDLVMRPAGLPESGARLIAVGLDGGELVLRIFDHAGVRIIDMVEVDLMPGEALTALKDSLNGSPPSDEAISTDAVLRADLIGKVLEIKAGTQYTASVPAGNIYITVAHGIGYFPETVVVNVIEGGSHLVEIDLSPLMRLNDMGWYAGEFHAHYVHGERDRMPTSEMAARIAKGSGFDWIYYNEEYPGTDGDDAMPYPWMEAQLQNEWDEDFKAWYGGEKPKSVFGHAGIINTDPFSIFERPPYYQSHALAQAQGGIVIPVHPTRMFPQQDLYNGFNYNKELVFDSFLGPSFDAFSSVHNEPFNRHSDAAYHTLLKRGHHLPVMADSDYSVDKFYWDEQGAGFFFSCVFLGNREVNGTNLAEAIRHGRTFATNGPILQFSIDDHISGDTLVPDGSERTVRIQADYHFDMWMLTYDDWDRNANANPGPVIVAEVQLLRNSEPIMSWKPNAKHFETEFTINEDEESYYMVRMFGVHQKWQYAVTSPIYFHNEVRPLKKEPFVSTVKGRVYDFETGTPIDDAEVEIIRYGNSLNGGSPVQVDANGHFAVNIYPDSDIRVTAPGYPPMTKSLLMDDPEIYRLTAYIGEENQNEDPGDPLDDRYPTTDDTPFDMMEQLLMERTMEFPLGFKDKANYTIAEFDDEVSLDSLTLISGPETLPEDFRSRVVPVAFFFNKSVVAPGDTVDVIGVFHAKDSNAIRETEMELAISNPLQPSAYVPFRPFDGSRFNGPQQILGTTYWCIHRPVTLPAEMANNAFGIGLRITSFAKWRNPSTNQRFRPQLEVFLPSGETKHEIVGCFAHPNLMQTFPNHMYGRSPQLFAMGVSNELPGENLSDITYDYRNLIFELTATHDSTQTVYTVNPQVDATGAIDADDAMMTTTLPYDYQSDITGIGEFDPVRTPQPDPTISVVPVDVLGGYTPEKADLFSGDPLAPVGTYARFRADHPGRGFNAPEDDMDLDGLSNLLEFALWMHPETGAPVAADATSENQGLIFEENSGGGMNLSYYKPVAIQGVTYEVQYAPSPGAWLPVPGVPTETVMGDGSVKVTYENVDGWANLSPARGFVRVIVTENP